MGIYFILDGTMLWRVLLWIGDGIYKWNVIWKYAYTEPEMNEWTRIVIIDIFNETNKI